MKALTLIVGLLSFVCFSNGIANDLEVYNDAGLNFTLYLNGQKVNNVLQDRVFISNTTHDIVHARVVFEDETIPLIEKKYLMINFPWSSANGNHPTTTVFKIIMKRGKYRFKKISRQYKPQGSQEELIFI